MGRTFRLFISSTFSDLEEERNALHRDVFPKLQRLCASKGARFQAIDLRWGVSDEAGLDQRTMPLCLDEIERCQKADRPNFLILLGDRYGWRPLPATIPASEFDLILERTEGEERERLNRWYVRDDNAVPAEYFLKPRDPEGDFGTSDDPKIKAERGAAWNSEASAMRAALLAAVADLDLSSDVETDGEARAKYVASATEQEIQRGAFRVPDAGDHVFGFLRTIDGLPADTSASAYRDLQIDGGLVTADDEAAAALSSLKNRLASYLPETTVSTTVAWDDGRPQLDLEAFCTAVEERLIGAIEERLALDEGVDSVALEAEAHRRFGENLARFFTGRDTPLAAIVRHLDGADARPLVVHGISGSGKSSLMAQAFLDSGSDGVQIVRFIGATSASSSGHGLLGDLCREIGAAYGVTDPVPDDFQELTTMFPERLNLATADRPLVVFIDAIDQLAAGDPGRRLGWLPTELPLHTRIVVSTLPGDTLAAASTRGAAILKLDPMPAVEAEGLLDRWLDDAGRTLQPEQRAEVLAAFDASGGLPLYLKLAFEEAKLWRSDDPHPALAVDVADLIRDNLFARLADPVNHGSLLVERALGYLAASQFGLAEDEIVEVLSRDEDVYSSIADRPYHRIPDTGDGEQPRIPVVVWARLYADLEPYLAERGADGATTLDFYHRQFREVAAESFLGDEDGPDRHSVLADMFHAKADPAGDGTWTGDDIRGLAETPYHLAEAERLDELYEVLTDFRFMERKVAEVGIVEQADGDRLYTGVTRLREDLDHALTKMRGGESADERRRIILTGVDLGEGLQIRCPHCNKAHPFDQEWRGKDINCPGEDCRGPLKINPFVVGEDPTERWGRV